MPGDTANRPSFPPAEVLARITGNPRLARIVADLPPEVLHAVIIHHGLQDCGELLALTTSEQLSAVLDLDLWRAERAGGDDTFDAARFVEWLDVLVDAGAGVAAARLAQMGTAVVVAGLSPHIEVFDLAVFSPVGEHSGADAVMNPGRERGVHAEIGGYAVVARREDAWDVVLAALLALDEHQPDAFHRAMRACRTLTNAGWERDGLDNLLPDDGQARVELAMSREERRERQGYLPPRQAAAFLHAARRVPLGGAAPRVDAVFAAYQRSVASEPPVRSQGRSTADAVPEGNAPAWHDSSSSAAVVIEMLRDAGVLADTPRARLPGAANGSARTNAALNEYLHACTDEDGWMTRNEELAFLANALIAGCPLQGGTFTRRQAMDAVAATCNLGLECWPPQWPAASTQTLVTAFQAGWSVLHRDVVLATADALLDALAQVPARDRELRQELHVLDRELRQCRAANTPWHARHRLDVLASFDPATWAALLALLDECPVMLANVSVVGGAPAYRVTPAEFQFIADRRDLAAVDGFLESLADRLKPPAMASARAAPRWRRLGRVHAASARRRRSPRP